MAIAELQSSSSVSRGLVGAGPESLSWPARLQRWWSQHIVADEPAVELSRLDQLDGRGRGRTF